jgi:hypothetical protein
MPDILSRASIRPRTVVIVAGEHHAVPVYFPIHCKKETSQSKVHDVKGMDEIFQGLPSLSYRHSGRTLRGELTSDHVEIVVPIDR